MALFTDGQINGTRDLQSHENAILDVAGVENIDLTGKLALAQDEIQSEILLYLLRKPLRDSKWPVRRSLGTADVVVTGPLKQWHAFKTLATVYRDAFNNQLNDRYRGKWKEYEQLAKLSVENYFQAGVALVADPVPKASAPALSAVAAVGAGGAYYVGMAWVNAAGQEGAASDAASLTTTNGTQLVVSNTNPPPNAVGWNIYAGNTPDSVALQNASPIAIIATWTPPPSGLRQGRAPSSGQLAERYLVHDRLIQRG